MDVSWSDWEVVAAAVEHGSFTKAAEALGVGQATVSRRVAAVEQALGHVLFDRHRSGLVLTPAARRMAPHLEAFRSVADEAVRALEGLEDEAAGEVRVAGPPGLCVDWMPRLARKLATTHPAIQLTVLSDIRPRDLDRREADIALRLVPTTRGDLLTRRLGSIRGGLFASPDLVDGLPPSARLSDVPLVQYSEELADIPLARFMASLGMPVALRTNDYLLMRASVSAGLGAGVFSELEAETHGWVPVPVELPPVPVTADLYLVVHRALRRVPRVAAVIEGIDALMEELGIPSG